MKKFCISLFLLSIILLTLILGWMGTSSAKNTETVEYLRLHIRADSNSEEDQAVKYKVRDEVVKFLTPEVAMCDTREKAEKMLKGNLKNIEKVADKVLKENGFDYTSKAEIKWEEFPTRIYDGITLEAGVYRSLIINLGSGSGNNWWCVVYPPLCFTDGGGNVTYRSKIYDIINDFKNKIKK